MRRVLMIGVPVAALLVAGTGGYWYLHRGNLVTDAQYRFSRGDVFGAELDLDAYLRAHPANAEASYRLGIINLAENNPVAAERNFRRAIAAHYNPKAIVLPLGEAYLRQRRYDDVLNDFTIDRAAPGTKADTYAVRASAYLALKRYPEAKQAAADGMASEPDAPDPMLVAARVDMAENDIAAAKVLVTRVLKQDPNRADAELLQAELSMHDNDPATALKLAMAVLNAAPARLDAKLAAARALAALHEDVKASKLVDEVLKRTPRDLGANYLRVVLAVRQRDFTTADNSLQVIQPEIDDLPQGNYFMAITKLGRNLPSQAQEAAAKYASRNPGDISGQKLLAFCELALHKPDRAIAVIKPLLDRGNPDADTLDLLARAQAMTGNLSGAEANLKQAAALQPNNTDILNRLAASKLGQGEIAAGEADLRHSLAAQPDQPTAARTLVQSALSQGDVAGAQTAVDALRKATGDTELVGMLDAEVKTARLDLAGAKALYLDIIKRYPESRDATFGLVQVEARMGDAKTAEDRLAGWMALHPTDKQGLRLQIKSLMAANDTQAATAAAEAAHAGNPVDTDITGMLASLYIADKRPQKAVELLDRAATSENPSLAALRGEALIQNKQYSEASAMLQASVAQAPTDQRARFALLDLDLRQQNYIAARSLITDGLIATPGAPRLMESLVALDLKTDGIKTALETASGLQKDPANMPAALLLPGGALAAKGDYSGAADAYLSAFHTAPSINLALAASSALIHANRRPEARALMEGWIATHPDEYTALQVLAALAINDHRMDDAGHLLDRVLKLRPADSVALNNMAWVQLDRNDPQGAHNFAMRAYYLAPGPETQDTLGWTLLKTDQPAAAVALLEQAAAARPTPAILYHYAAALKASGRPADARAAIDRALADKKSFDERPDAEKLQAGLSQ
jgi:putative PEP-CTERM system TPR-repeat lipoprotein